MWNVYEEYVICRGTEKLKQYEINWKQWEARFAFQMLTQTFTSLFKHGRLYNKSIIPGKILCINNRRKYIRIQYEYIRVEN